MRVEELNQSVEPEAVDLAPLGLDVSFRPSSDSRAPCLATISSRLVRVDKVTEGRGLSTGAIESPKYTRNVGVAPRYSRRQSPTQGGRGQASNHLSQDPFFCRAQHNRWPKVQGGPIQKPSSVLFCELVEDCAPATRKQILRQDPQNDECPICRDYRGGSGE